MSFVCKAVYLTTFFSKNDGVSHLMIYVQYIELKVLIKQSHTIFFLDFFSFFQIQQTKERFFLLLWGC